MSWLEILEKMLQYGPSIILIIVFSFTIKPLVQWAKSVSSRLNSKAIRIKELETVVKQIQSQFNVIEKIDEKIVILEGRNTLIEADLAGIRTQLGLVETMTRQMHDHFLGEGLKNGRRSDDK